MPKIPVRSLHLRPYDEERPTDRASSRKKQRKQGSTSEADKGADGDNGGEKQKPHGPSSATNESAEGTSSREEQKLKGPSLKADNAADVPSPREEHRLKGPNSERNKSGEGASSRAEKKLKGPSSKSDNGDDGVSAREEQKPQSPIYDKGVAVTLAREEKSPKGPSLKADNDADGVSLREEQSPKGPTSKADKDAEENIHAEDAAECADRKEAGVASISEVAAKLQQSVQQGVRSGMDNVQTGVRKGIENVQLGMHHAEESIRQQAERQWAILSDKREVAFEWPSNCQLEVREQVDPEHFDAKNPKYTMPFFWLPYGVPATRSWAVIVCGIECGFGVVCLLVNLIHFAIFLPSSHSIPLPSLIFFITMMQLSIFFAFKVLFIFSVLAKSARLLHVQLVFQYVTAVFLLLNSSFTLAADFGGFPEERLYVQRDPPLIRFLAFLSLLFLFVQLYLRVMTRPVWKFLHDSRKFRQAISNAQLRYRKRVFFTYCSMMHEHEKRVKEAMRQRAIEEEARRRSIEEGAVSDDQATFLTSEFSDESTEERTQIHTGTSANHETPRRKVGKRSRSRPAVEGDAQQPSGDIWERRWSSPENKHQSPPMRPTKLRRNANDPSPSDVHYQSRQRYEVSRRRQSGSPPKRNEERNRTRRPVRRNRLKKAGVPFQNLLSRSVEIRIELKPNELQQLLGGGASGSGPGRRRT